MDAILHHIVISETNLTEYIQEYIFQLKTRGTFQLHFGLNYYVKVIDCTVFEK